MRELVDGAGAHEAWAGASQDLLRENAQPTWQISGVDWQAAIRW